MTVDQLDLTYWAEVERAGPGGYARYWLSSLALGPDVDPGDWQAFVSDYFAASERMLAPYDHVRLTAERVYSSTEAGGKTSRYPWRYELKRSGPLQAFRVIDRDREEVYLANPAHSFRAERPAGGNAWKIRAHPDLSREQLYRWVLSKIDTSEPVTGSTAPLIELADFATRLGEPFCLRVAKLARFTEKGRRLIRVELDDCPPGHPIYRKIDLTLSGDDYSPVHAENATKTGKLGHGDAVVVYDSAVGVPVLQSTRHEGRADDKSLTTSTLAVIDRHFGPVPEEEFTPERLLAGAPVHQIAADDGPSDVAAFLNWYPLPVGLGLVALAAGAGLLPWARVKPA